MKSSDSQKPRLPDWFKVRLGTSRSYARINGLLGSRSLNTVCKSAACPNRTECWNSGTAAFLILGNICSRQCAFCGVPKGVPGAVDHEEPLRVAELIARLGLRYAVVTSVTRDDLEDGGASLFAETIRHVRMKVPGAVVEVLIPDFQGSREALERVIEAGPDVLNHNIETVPSLYGTVRPGASFERSIELLWRASMHGMRTKSGIMLGLGESYDEIEEAFKELRSAGCSMLTIGQYLSPSKNSIAVKRYYRPEEFEEIGRIARNMGFRSVYSGPRVRSSYRADTEGGMLGYGSREVDWRPIKVHATD